MTFPVRFAVIVPAAKLPEASRLTMVLAVFALVAALAATVARLTFAAVDPPTVTTTVAPWGPETLPDKEPEKLTGVEAACQVPLPLASEVSTLPEAGVPALGSCKNGAPTSRTPPVARTANS